MSDRSAFALYQRLSRLETPAEASRVCGETPTTAHNSTAPSFMLTCIEAPHGTSKQHRNRLGQSWGLVERPIDRVPERRR